MNTLGLNVFIAIVGISAGPGFVAGLQQVGLSIFLWGMVATTPAADRGGTDRPPCLQVPSRDTVRCLRRRAHDDGGARHGSGSGKEQGARARLRHALRDRQHAAHDLRHGDRAADDARRLTGTTIGIAGGANMDIVKLREYEALSPFEIKDFLAKAANTTPPHRRSRTSTRAAAIPTGSPPSRERPSFCWGSSRSARANGCWTFRPAWAACRGAAVSPTGWPAG